MRRLLLTAFVLLLASATAADAATRHVIRGRGFGHGVGMSQYGAYGFAQHGRDFRDILGHYYRGTSVRRARSACVLLMAGRGSVRFRGASRLAGVRALDKRATYTVRPSGGRLGLYRGSRLRGATGCCACTARAAPSGCWDGRSTTSRAVATAGRSTYGRDRPAA